MFKVTKEIFFCYGHRLMDYPGPCRHPHGHNAKVEVKLLGDSLDKNNVLVRFEEIKSTIEDWINAELDHRMLLNKKDPLVEALQKLDEPYYLFDTNPTAELLAKHIFEYAKGKGLPVEEIKLWENETSCAAYRE